VAQCTVPARPAYEAHTRPTATRGAAHGHAGQNRLVGRPTLGPNAGPSAHGARCARAHGDGSSRRHGRLRRTTPTPAEHSGTDSSFGGDDARRQRGWNGKEGEPGRRRGRRWQTRLSGGGHYGGLEQRGGFTPGEVRGRRRTARRHGLPIRRRWQLRAEAGEALDSAAHAWETVRSERRRVR
jgi:hypothetical protein